MGIIPPFSLPALLNVAIGMSGSPLDEHTASDNYQLPAGFSLQIFSSGVEHARFLRFTRAGDLLVSRPRSGDIILLRADSNGDGKADGKTTVITGLNRPQGLDFHGAWLYIAERDQVGRIRFDHDSGVAEGNYEPVISGLTGDGNHWSKTLRFGQDGLLYLAQGSTCNVCIEEDSRRATMMRFRADGSGAEIFATGLRNSVGFDWAPWNNALYATDNGRDLLGDDFPPCELNLVEEGKFYGWPYYNGNNITDPDMGTDPLASKREPTAPAHNFAAHNAPLGMSFVDSSNWPGDFSRVALTALHGSWNRGTPDGYRVVSLHFTGGGEADTKIEERDFFSGFNKNGEIIGRPVDVAQGPDGDIYVSDDYAGAIYRISPNHERKMATSDVDAARAAARPTQQRLDERPPKWLANANKQRLYTIGEGIYKQHECGSCHQERDKGSVSLAGLHKRLGYDAVIDTLLTPRAPMPSVSLSQEQRRALAVYLLARK